MQATTSPHIPFADADPPRPVRRALIQIYVTPAERELVRERAFRERTSQSSWVRRAIAEYMSGVEPERKAAA